jgi:predicted phosphate transport protein (TIGR00153 family)
MFAWFQRLLPKTGNFFEQFEGHAALGLAAARATAKLLDGGPDRPALLVEINRRENEADEITRDVLKSVRATFLTPFDRGAITALIGALDDTIDEMYAAASAIDLYRLTEFAPEMREMAQVAVDAAGLAVEAMPLLRDVSRNGPRLHELTEQLIRLEGRADDCHAAGLRRSLEQYGKSDTLRFVVEREIYKHLERILDAFEDVADEIDGIVIDHA